MCRWSLWHFSQSSSSTASFTCSSRSLVCWRIRLLVMWFLPNCQRSFSSQSARLLQCDGLKSSISLWTILKILQFERSSQFPFPLILQAIAPVNVIIYVFFIVVVILYFVMDQTVEVNCTSTEEERNAVSLASEVAIGYKVCIYLKSFYDSL